MKNSDPCVLAVDAGGTSLKAALVWEDRFSKEPKILSFFSVPVNSAGSREEILEAYRAVGRQGARLALDTGLSVERIAVCVPGPFDYSRGSSLMRHKYQAVYQVPLGPWLLQGAGADCPVIFLHDSSAFLLGAVLDVPEKRDRVCAVIIGTGLGFASMVDGKLLETLEGGPAVSIYSRPYLDKTGEDYVSKRGITRRYLNLTGKNQTALPSVAHIADMARAGDTAALKTFRDTGFHLGQLLLPVLEEYHFDTVLLGGAISKSADLFLPDLCQVLSRAGAQAFPAAHIDQAPLLGAVMYTGHSSVR